MNNSKSYWVGLIVVVLIAIGGFMYLRSQIAQSFGSAGTRFPHGISVNSVTAPSNNGLRIGDNGSENIELQGTTCNLDITAGRLPLATSTQPFQCAVTGVVANDQVLVQLTSDGGSLSGTGGIVVGYAKASTTAGFIEVGLYSRPTSIGTTVATSSFALATTSIQIWRADQ